MNWKVLAASSVGTSHAGRGTPCQDACRYLTFGTSADWLVVAVADGAGSASQSEVGAKLVCDELVNRGTALSPDHPYSREWAVELFTAVRNELVAEAERRAVRPRELACTTLLAVVGPQVAAFAQIGDGAIVTGDGTTHRIAFWPQQGEYANETDFLTDDRFVDSLHFDIHTGPITELAVMTDGLQRLALDYSTRRPHAPFFSPLFAEMREAPDTKQLDESFRGFLASDRVNARTDDDKTLVLAVR